MSTFYALRLNGTANMKMIKQNKFHIANDNDTDCEAGWV
jgi:hypothetical protein